MTVPATIVVTRPEDNDGPLTRLLRDAGHTVLHWQVTTIGPPADPEPLHDALRRLERYDWIVFSSAAAVNAVIAITSRPPQRLRVAAVGAATAKRLRDAGWPVDLIPAQAGAEFLAAALVAQTHKPTRVLFPASAEALPALSRQLRQAGVAVDQVEAYRLVDAAGPADTWRSLLAQGRVDAVTFTSPSAVTRLHQSLGESGFRKLADVIVVVIGETTAAALRSHGLQPTAIAPSSSLEALASATITALAARAPAPAKA